MGVERKRVIFIGPDCGGKSTLAALYAREVDEVVESFRRSEEPIQTLIDVVADVQMLRVLPRKSFVRDQWKFPVDIIYKNAMGDPPSVIEPLHETLAEAYRKAGVIFVYVTASPEEIARRFGLRGDELWDLGQILDVHDYYEDHYEQWGQALYMLRIDTTGANPEEQVLEIVQKVNHMIEGLEEGQYV